VASPQSLLRCFRQYHRTWFSLKVRPHDGWHWLLVSGLVALFACIAFLVKFQLLRVSAPDITAGISLLFAGTTYIAIGLMAKRFDRLPRTTQN